MDNLWTRRTNSNKLSLSTPAFGESHGSTPNGDSTGRGSAFPKRIGHDTLSSLSKKSPFATPSGGISTPSSAFGLGSGAFASFGSARTPKSPGIPFEATLGSCTTKTPTAEKPTEELVGKTAGGRRSSIMTPISETSAVVGKSGAAASTPPSPSLLKDPWCFWFRPPMSKSHSFVEYEDTLHGIATVQTVEDFFTVYRHLKRPSVLPIVSDYHLFKKGIRPIWEDEENKRGGKWVVRLKKGVSDRLWEDLLFALVGDQFGDASEDVCGVVLSIRNGEDTLSIWTRSKGGRVLRIRETMKHTLGFPPNTRVEFKSHDSSIQQRTAIEESRREKAATQPQGEKRQSLGSTKTPAEEKWEGLAT